MFCTDLMRALTAHHHAQCVSHSGQVSSCRAAQCTMKQSKPTPEARVAALRAPSANLEARHLYRQVTPNQTRVRTSNKAAHRDPTTSYSCTDAWRSVCATWNSERLNAIVRSCTSGRELLEPADQEPCSVSCIDVSAKSCTVRSLGSKRLCPIDSGWLRCTGRAVGLLW